MRRRASPTAWAWIMVLRISRCIRLAVLKPLRALSAFVWKWATMSSSTVARTTTCVQRLVRSSASNAELQFGNAAALIGAARFFGAKVTIRARFPGGNFRVADKLRTGLGLRYKCVPGIYPGLKWDQS